jgi:acyl-CoA hydrolase
VTRRLTSLDETVAALFAHSGARLVLAAPLGLGKPHRLLNAIYDATVADPRRSLDLFTALSLTPPSAGKGLQKRFLGPFLDRHFGADFQALKYSLAQRADALPDNVRVEEFYLQSGGLLDSEQAQQSYSSLNYTHVARAVAAKRINALVQKVAIDPTGTHLSLSCNPDLSFDLLDEVARLGFARPLMVAEIDPHLPYIGGTACVPIEFFDLVLDLPGPAPALFALPRGPVTDADYAIGLRASALVKDGGTLQIGIGSLSDALCHCLILRHERNDEYRRLLQALDPELAQGGLVRDYGGLEPFSQGLYGASEMVNDGFMRLARAGILKRRVLDDVAAMERIHAGRPTAQDSERLEREGRWLDGGFYLGSTELYAWLRDMTEAERGGIGMTRISHINELYGGNESLERLQRRHARFFNTCMMGTLLGAAVSDALADGRVVSGVGGQYNFVAMAHALRDGRSVLMFRAVREDPRGSTSSVLWNYGHCTIPRHLRDIMITEYGVADLRGASDAECIGRMLELADARFQPGLLKQAMSAKKTPRGSTNRIDKSSNTPARLSETLRPFRSSGVLPDYPLGSDFTPVEERLVRALAWLKSSTASFTGKLRTIATAVAAPGPRDEEALERMGLSATTTFADRLDARLITLALNKAAQ